MVVRRLSSKCIVEMTANTAMARLGQLIQKEDDAGLLSEAQITCIEVLNPSTRSRRPGSRKKGQGMAPIFLHRVIDLGIWKDQTDLSVSPTSSTFNVRPVFNDVMTCGLRAGTYMNEWIERIEETYTMFQAHEKGMPSGLPSKDEPSNQIAHSIYANASIKDAIMRTLISGLCMRSCQSVLYRVLGNFERAAFYLRYLLLVDMDFPESFAELEAALGCADDAYWKLQ